MNENLNIDDHTKVLLLKAMARSKNEIQVSKLLGVSERTIPRLKKKFGIRYDPVKKEYIVPLTEGSNPFISKLKETKQRN